MCGRFVQVLNIKKAEERFGIISSVAPLGDNYNVSPGDYAYVITDAHPARLEAFCFGLTPNWAKKPMYLINARAEGDFNKENSQQYNGPKGILKKPSFGKLIRSRRCLVLANAFIEGPEKVKLDAPFAVSLKDDEVFAMAGIWDVWQNEQGEELNSFAIITAVANSLLNIIEHPRCPVILDKQDEKRWLDSRLPLVDALALLKPYSGELLKATPISVKIKNPRNKGSELLVPVGKVITTDSPIEVIKELKLQGMGSNKRKNKPPDWQGKLF